MRSSTICRRRSALATGWTPASLAGVVAWWHADDLAGTNGAAIGSWTDKIAGLTVTQATGANQPTLTTAGATGAIDRVTRKSLTFNGSSHILRATGGIGSIPAQGPLTVYLIQKASATPSFCFALEVASATSQGYAFGSYSGTMTFSARGVHDYQPGTLTGAGDLSLFGMKFTSGFAVQDTKNARYPIPFGTASGSSQITAGATAISIGGSGISAGLYYPGDMFDVIICTGNTGTSDDYALAQWAYEQYSIVPGTSYNATASVTTDATNGCIEVSVLDMGVSGWNGKRYWLGFSPFGVSGIASENPSVLCSTDGNTWTVPAGGSNPVVAYPGGGNAGNNSDARLFDNTARDGFVYLFYQRENTSPVSTGGVWYTRSSDGITWSAVAQVITAAHNNSDLEPVLFYDGTQYVMWTLDVNTGAGNYILYRRTSASVASGWSARTACTVAWPAGLNMYHISNVIKIGSKYVIVCPDNGQANDGNNRSAWLMSSTDGLAWQVSRYPLIVRSVAAWDRGSIYRPGIQDAGDATNINVWYPGTVNADLSGFQLAQKIQVPQTLIP